MSGPIAFQGVPGAYSDLACRSAFPTVATLPCPTFEAAIEAVREGRAAHAMLPCENTLAGRIPDIHHLLPDSGLHVVGEHFQRIEHCLLAPRGAAIAGLRRAHSHAVALGQVRTMLRELGLQPVVEADTAGSAQLIAERGTARTPPSLRRWRPRSTGSTSSAPTSRTQRTTPRAFTSWRPRLAFQTRLRPI